MPQEAGSPTPENFFLIILFNLALAATLATMLVRFKFFRRILVSERRDWRARLTLAAGLGIPLTAGVLARVWLHYEAADLTLSGSLLAGLIGGPYVGALVGVAVGLPPLPYGEYASLPLAVGCGFAGSGLRHICPPEEIWNFSPFFFTNIYKSAWRLVRRLSIEWQLLLFASPIALETLRQALGRRFHILRVFYLLPPTPWMWAVLMVGTVLAVAIPIKIWNTARIEHRLAEQEQLLMAAKLEALANQINPHFLFNTLTSISSLIRSQPETARVLIVKLSGLLRRLLRTQEHFVTLREELEAVGEYLDIERVRFGNTLVVEQQIDDASLDAIVPSMILQPLVENSIKHGLGRKIGEGRVTIRATRQNGKAIIEVVDNGIGMPSDRLETTKQHGIGLSNVNERLRVIYGPQYELKLHSVAGEGTSARIEIPEILASERASA